MTPPPDAGAAGTDGEPGDGLECSGSSSTGGSPVVAKSEPASPPGQPAAKATGKKDNGEAKKKAGGKRASDEEFDGVAPKAKRSKPAAGADDGAAADESAKPAKAKGKAQGKAQAKSKGNGKGNAKGKASTEQPEASPEGSTPQAAGGEGTAEAAARQADEMANAGAKPSWDKDKAREWAAFQRSMGPATARSRVARIPAEIALQLKGMDEKDKMTMTNKYFMKWLQSDKDWGKVTIEEVTETSSSTSSSGGHCWMTRPELLEKYKQDTVIVDAIVSAKEQDPAQWRPHPDAPDCKQAIQYRVFDKEGDSWDNKVKQSSAAKLKTEVDREAGKFLLPQRLEALATAGPGVAATASVVPAGGGGRGNNKALSAEERAEREAKRAAEKQAKADEREREKNKPETKLAKWLAGLSKDVVTCKQLVAEASASTLPAGVASDFRSAFASHEELLVGLRADMEKAQGPQEAQALLTRAPAIVNKFQDDIKAFKKIKAIYVPPVKSQQ